MDGREFVLWVEEQLEKHDIPKERFYKDCGISSSNFSQWRNGVHAPSRRAMDKVRAYFEGSAGKTEPVAKTDDPAVDALSRLRDCDRALLEVTRGMKEDAVYAMRDMIRKLKGEENDY